MKLMIDEEYLQPCPICGGISKINTIRISEKDRLSTSYIYCENCGLILMGKPGKYYKRSEMISMWNTRVNLNEKEYENGNNKRGN